MSQLDGQRFPGVSAIGRSQNIVTLVVETVVHETFGLSQRVSGKNSNFFPIGTDFHESYGEDKIKNKEKHPV